MDSVILKNLGIWIGIKNNYGLTYNAFQDFKKRICIKTDSNPYIDKKKILEIYIQYAALINQINLKAFPVQKLVLYLSWL